MYSAISLFTGLGGLDFGFEKAGFETTVAVDIDEIAARTAADNRSWPYINQPLECVSSARLLQISKLRAEDVDVVIGGPPCQPFSKSGYWANGDSQRLHDPRAGSLHEFIRVVRDVTPKVFLLENVPGLAFKGKSEGIEFLENAIATVNSQKQTNYQLSVATLNAANFGVPQMRERVFVVGARNGQNFRFPEKTHVARHDVARGVHLAEFVTAWEALAEIAPSGGELEDLRVRGKWAALLPTIPEGENYLWHTERGGGLALFGWRRRYWNFLLKLAKDRPSWTVQAQPGPATGPFHWDSRKLSKRELCRVQAMPDHLKFNCSHADCQKMVGNAVPSALAESLAREIATQFLGAPKLNEPLRLLARRSVKRPTKTRLKPVPETYMDLLSSDTAHPGTGMGRAARVRLSAAE